MIVPAIELHKHGKYVTLKPCDPQAADILSEVRERLKSDEMRKTSHYGILENPQIADGNNIEVYKCLDGNLEDNPLLRILKSYGVQVSISDTLKNYLKKEARKQALEAAPYPLPPVINDVSLFDRCCEGLVLRCIKDYVENNKTIFYSGRRYFVVAVGGDGKDVVVISTKAVESKVEINAEDLNQVYEWTTFHSNIEEWFDDSESTDTGKDIQQLYPERIKAMEKKLKALNLPLYEHVEVDACMMALKRGVLNAYPMRMAKTSAGIAVAELSGSKKIAIISPGNARIFWVKEFNRLGFQEGRDYAVINSFEDVNNPAKYHLYTFNWLRYKKDSEEKKRNKYEGLLKPSWKTIRIQDPSRPHNLKAKIESTEDLYNNCPHCEVHLERFDKDTGIWTTKRGYICRNKQCLWTSYYMGNEVIHTGGYVNLDLAIHCSCEDEKIKGRLCPTCCVADSEWRPPRYKRLTKKYTHVIIDEAHAGKDSNSDTAAASFNFRARRRQELTGTPISNSPMDIYWLLHWTCKAPSPQFSYFGSEGAKEFDKRFCDQIYIDRSMGTDMDEMGNEVEIVKTVRKRIPFLKNPPDFWKFMAPKVRRRTYQDKLYQKTLIDSGKKQPQPDIKKVSVEMDGIQARLLLDSLKDFKAAFEKMKAEAEEKNQLLNMARIQNMSQMVTMRILATCPEALNDKFGTNIYTGPIGGGKLARIVQIVEEKVELGEKVVILSDFRAMQKTVAEHLKPYGVIRFDTSWKEDKRAEAFELFQTEDKYKVFVGGTRAIRESVDLSAANTCICCDLLWSPGFQTQAWSRIMAPTEMERVCEVWLLLSKNSIDEHIYNTFYSKMMAAAQAMDRKVLERRAKEVDVKWFVDRILEAEQSLAVYVRDQGFDDMVVQKLDLNILATEREA